MSERTWEVIGNEIQDDYLRAGGPENVRFREVQWEVWVAEVERAAAEKAWSEGAESAFYNPEIRGYVDYPDENPYRQERGEQ